MYMFARQHQGLQLRLLVSQSVLRLSYLSLMHAARGALLCMYVLQAAGSHH